MFRKQLDINKYLKSKGPSPDVLGRGHQLPEFSCPSKVPIGRQVHLSVDRYKVKEVLIPSKHFYEI